MLAARITLAHFSVSSAMSLPKSAGEPQAPCRGYGFHIYDDGGARWITIRYETEDAEIRTPFLALTGDVGGWVSCPNGTHTS